MGGNGSKSKKSGGGGGGVLPQPISQTNRFQEKLNS